MLFFATAFALEITTPTWKGDRYTVVTVEPGERQALVGQADRAQRTLQAALRANPEARVAVASGMYHAGRVPVGLHIEGGEELAPIERRALDGNFGLQPNGVFAVGADGPRVVVTEAWSGDAAFATQSGPMLVIDGALHPAFNEDSPSKRIRHGVGVDGAGRTYWVISEQPVRFHDLATFFRDGLGCPDALYLDGTVSRLAVRDTRVQDGFFGGVWVLGDGR